jgi:hypothetical protein
LFAKVDPKFTFSAAEMTISGGWATPVRAGRAQACHLPDGDTRGELVNMNDAVHRLEPVFIQFNANPAGVSRLYPNARRYGMGFERASPSSGHKISPIFPDDFNLRPTFPPF